MGNKFNRHVMKSMDNLPGSQLSELIKKYDFNGPYYTSYPTAKRWSENFGPDSYRDALRDMMEEKTKVPLSLYFHIPFCKRRCRFCFCHTMVAGNTGEIDSFLGLLFREIKILKDFFDACHYVPDIREIHLGGGSPSILNKKQFDKLVDNISLLVDPGSLDEFAMEIDAGTVDREKLARYSDRGISRISFGIQDFDPKVQKAIDRIQPERLIADLFGGGTREWFKSVNFDLMYGLPSQSIEGIKRTVETAIKFKPQRVALYNYFHMPSIYKNQAAIPDADLPGPVEKQKIFSAAVKVFKSNGYRFIGIDHFARPGSDLDIAEQKGTLYRHFMGYTAGRAVHLAGLGPTSLSGFTRYYAQNVYSLDDYAQRVSGGKFPTFRGCKLSRDDLTRRDAINKLLSFFLLDFKAFSRAHGIDFKMYFSRELKLLETFAADGILELGNDKIIITALGRFFARHVCAVFDSYVDIDVDAKSGKAIYVPQVQKSRSL